MACYHLNLAPDSRRAWLTPNNAYRPTSWPIAKRDPLNASSIPVHRVLFKMEWKIGPSRAPAKYLPEFPRLSNPNCHFILSNLAPLSGSVLSSPCGQGWLTTSLYSHPDLLFYRIYDRGVALCRRLSKWVRSYKICQLLRSNSTFGETIGRYRHKWIFTFLYEIRIPTSRATLYRIN